MYTTCIYCNRPLGANDAIEHFPVGRRLAFDAAKGRLWVVCPRCARWNLTPLEERWEAIEECERSFRDTRLRAQTDQIGLARLREGLELIRIGQPLRPEFAAWRYGDLFGARLRRTVTLGAIGVAAGGAALAGLALAGLHLGPVVPYLLPFGGGWGVPAALNLGPAWRDYFRTTYVPRRGDRPYAVVGANLKETHLVTIPDGDRWALQLRYMTGADMLTGDTARRALAVVLARVNEHGATSGITRRAAERLAEAGGPEPYVARLAALSVRRTGDYAEQRARFRRTVISKEFVRRAPPVDDGSLPRLDRVDRLALEMAVHEEEERRAMEGELALLEAAWRDAEEIAAIADDLLLPADVGASLTRLRARASRSRSRTPLK